MIVIQGDPEDRKFADQWINLAEERLGSEVLYATDDFFAEKENLVKPGRGIFVPDKFTERGKWMDGWESRRKRTEGHDYVIIKLGLSGVIKGVDIDTNHFTGNYPEYASLEATCLDCDPNDNTEWTEILTQQKLQAGSQHLFEISNSKRWTHVRLHIYPDGGVARLRVYGEVKKDWSQVGADDLIDLAHVENEGKALSCSDMYFSHQDNINAPGKGVNMGDGWETKRRRGPGFDWLIIALGKPGIIKKIIVDTAHFKGNYPDRCSIDALFSEGPNIDLNAVWKPFLFEQKLEADQEHTFTKFEFDEVVSHLKLNIFPDGGVSRLRVFGNIK